MLNFTVNKILKWLGFGRKARKQVSNVLSCTMAVVDMGSDVLVCGFWIVEGEPFWGINLAILIVAGNIVAQKLFNNIVKESPFDTKEMRYAFLLDLGTVIFTYQNWDYLSMATEKKKRKKKKTKKTTKNKDKDEEENETDAKTTEIDIDTSSGVIKRDNTVDDDEVEQLQLASLAQTLYSMAKLNEILLESMLCGAFQLYSIVTSNSYNELLIASLLLSLGRISNGVEKNLADAQKQQSIAHKMVDKMIYRQRKSTRDPTLQSQSTVPTMLKDSLVLRKENSSSPQLQSPSENDGKHNNNNDENAATNKKYGHGPSGSMADASLRLFQFTLEDLERAADRADEIEIDKKTNDNNTDNNNRMTLSMAGLSLVNSNSPKAHSPEVEKMEIINEDGVESNNESKIEPKLVESGGQTQEHISTETQTTQTDTTNTFTDKKEKEPNQSTDKKEKDIKTKLKDGELHNFKLVFNTRQGSIEMIDQDVQGDDDDKGKATIVEAKLPVANVAKLVSNSNVESSSKLNSGLMHRRQSTTVVNYEFKPKYFKLYEIASKVFVGADTVVRVLSKSLYAGVFVPAWPYAAISVLLGVLTVYYGSMSFIFRHESNKKWYNLILASVVANVSFLGETPDFLQTALSKLIVGAQKRLFFTYFLSFILFIGWIVASLTIDTLDGYCLQDISSSIQSRTFYRNCKLCYEAMGQPYCDSNNYDEENDVCSSEFKPFSDNDRQECAWNLALDLEEITCGVDSSATNCFIINPMKVITAERWIIVFVIAFVVVIASTFVIIWADKELLIMQKINMDVKIQLKTAGQRKSLMDIVSNSQSVVNSPVTSHPASPREKQNPNVTDHDRTEKLVQEEEQQEIKDWGQSEMRTQKECKANESNVNENDRNSETIKEKKQVFMD